MIDLTWTIQRVSQRTALERHGASMLALLARCWEHVSRFGEARGPGETAGTSAIVPWDPHPCQRRRA